MRTRWKTSVVGYDLRTQVIMLRKLAKLFASEDGNSANDRENERQIERDAWKRLGRTALIVALSLCLIAGLIVWRSRRRRRPAQRPLPKNVEQAVKLYREIERALGSSGHARSTAVTPAEHARALETPGLPCAREVSEVTESYMRVRYGGETIADPDLPRLHSAVAKVRKAGTNPAANSGAPAR